MHYKMLLICWGNTGRQTDRKEMQLQASFIIELTDNEVEILGGAVGKSMIPTVYREVVRKSLSSELLSKIADIDVVAKREKN